MEFESWNYANNPVLNDGFQENVRCEYLNQRPTDWVTDCLRITAANSGLQCSYCFAHFLEFIYKCLQIGGSYLFFFPI